MGGLRLTRAVGSLLYGGEKLDPDNPEETYDHKMWVRRVRDHDGAQDCLVTITDREGRADLVLTVGDKPSRLSSSVSIQMVGIQTYFYGNDDYCEVCGRGDPAQRKSVPQAQILVKAPRKYQVIRENTRKRKQ